MFDTLDTFSQVIGPFDADEAFINEDFALLEQYTLQTSASEVEAKIKSLGLDLASNT